MHLYVYDDFLQEKKNDRDVRLMEHRLTDIGISGKIIRLALFRSAEEQIRDEAKRGASTVVVVGNDDTLHKVLGAISEVDLPLGMIPIGEGNEFAKLLGISSTLQACDVLSARMIERVDTGLLNGQRFVTGVRVPTDAVRVDCHKEFRVTFARGGELEIQNMRALGSTMREVADPKDGRLDLQIQIPKPTNNFFRSERFCSHFFLTHMRLSAENPFFVIVDGVCVEGNDFSITLEPKRLQVIAGTDRLFS
jgi:diacylglycerol kinase family enzyme